ncbi:MAG: molybdenum ABC transporter ATP-binding protein [Pseudomonadota bacterium]
MRARAVWSRLERTPMSLDVSIAHAYPGFALDVAFRVERPGITALFGPSGAGKSSVIQAVAGLLRPEEGRIAIAGETVFDAERGVMVAPRRRRLGLVFQDARLFPHLSVAANLDYGARRARPRPTGPQRDEVIALLGIEALLTRRPAGLSGGERQRVALGRALLANPRLLLLDEPLAALDPARKAEILPYLERLRDQARLPILYVSHAIDEVTRLADDMLVLSKGTVAAAGPVEDIMARLDLFPLTGRFEAGAVIRATLTRHLGAERLSEATFPGGVLRIAALDAPLGTPLRLRIRARDVMLALRRPEGLSARNILAVRLAEIRPEDGPYADIRLECAGTGLLARVTKSAVAELGLRPGLELFAIIKTVSLTRASTVRS